MITRLRRLRQRLVRLTGPMTSLGRSVLIGGVVCLAVGAWFDWEELLVIGAAAGVGLLISVPFTFGRTDLRVENRLLPPRVVAGERAVAEVMVANAAPRRMLPVRIEIPIGRGFASIDVPSLAGGEAFEEVVVIPTSRRSVVDVGPTRSVRGDPLGLMRREVQWTERSELYVHPVTSTLRGLSTGWLRDLEGQATNKISVNDVAFHTLREYVPGDDRRHVHWRSSAKIGTLMVRQFIDNRRSQLGLVISTNPAEYRDADEFELVISMAASLGLRAIRDGQEVTCVCGTTPVSAHSGQSLLDGLARAELGDPPVSLHETTTRGMRYLTGASVVMLGTGSAVGVPELQLAAEALSMDARVLALRGSTTGTSARQLGRMTLLEAGNLDDFTRLMWSVTR